jgi:hypothetical protein
VAVALVQVVLVAMDLLILVVQAEQQLHLIQLGQVQHHLE